MKEWFRHDVQASQDANLRILTGKRGLRALGLYWIIVEDLYSNGGSLTKDILSVILKTNSLHDESQVGTDLEPSRTDLEPSRTDLKRERRKLRTDVELMIKLGLFVKTETGISSERVISELAAREDKSNKASLSAKQRWKGNANAMQTHSDGNALTIQNNTVQKSNNNIPPLPPAEAGGGSVQKPPTTRAEEIELARDFVANRNKPTWADLNSYGQLRGYSPQLVEDYWDWMEGRRWMVGEGQGKPIGVWRSHFDSHIRMKAERAKA